MVRSAVIAMAFSMLAWVVAPPAAGRADVGPPDTDSIAFTGDNGSSDVFLVDVGGGALINLTAHPASDRSPVWSPTGTRMAFISDRDGEAMLFVLGPSGVVAVAPAEDLDWAWSPDGGAIAWVLHSTWPDLWVIDAATGISSNLTNGTMSVGGPSWSPDSTRLLFESSDEAGFKDIYTVPRSGGSAVKLTGDSPGEDREPVWSPNGAQIAFVSQRDETNAIYVMNADGTNPELLVNAPEVESCGIFSLGSLAWSPDGTRIAYAARPGCGSPVSQVIRYYVVDLFGGPPTFLTTGGAFRGSGPMWSPDGTKLAVVDGSWSEQDVIVVGGPTAPIRSH